MIFSIILCLYYLFSHFFIFTLSAPITNSTNESEDGPSLCTVCMESYNLAEKSNHKDVKKTILGCGEWGYYYGLICIEAYANAYFKKVLFNFTNESDSTEAEIFCQKYCLDLEEESEEESSNSVDFELFYDDYFKYENYSHTEVGKILVKQVSCGVTFIEAARSYMTLGTKWSKNHLTYAISNESLILPFPSIRSGLHFAFDIWSKVIPLNFSEVLSLETADIKIYFISEKNSSSWEFLSEGRPLAYTNLLTSTIYFNTDFQWTFMNFFEKMIDHQSFLPVAIHEIGHVLGLTHSRNCSSVMAPVHRNGSLILPFLIEDDIVRIQRIYGPRETGASTSASDMPYSFYFMLCLLIFVLY